MPRILALVLQAIVAAPLAFGYQTPGEQRPNPKKQHFLIRITPARGGFVENPTAGEQKTMAEHFAYLKGQAAQGKVILAGPSINGDKTFGIIVVEVVSRAEADSIMQGDPSVKAGVMKGGVLPFNLAILQGR
jgi:uncharacterized protein YciI